MKMRKGFIILIAILFLTSCEKDFYRHSKRWDLWRFPLVNPLELISATNSHWSLPIKGFNPYHFKLERTYQISSIDSIGVLGKQIFVHSQRAGLPNGGRPAWFIIEKIENEKFDVIVIEEDSFNKADIELNLGGKLTLYSPEILTKNYQEDFSLPKEWGGLRK